MLLLDLFIFFYLLKYVLFCKYLSINPNFIALVVTSLKTKWVFIYLLLKVDKLWLLVEITDFWKGIYFLRAHVLYIKLFTSKYLHRTKEIFHRNGYRDSNVFFIHGFNLSLCLRNIWNTHSHAISCAPGYFYWSLVYEINDVS